MLQDQVESLTDLVSPLTPCTTAPPHSCRSLTEPARLHPLIVLTPEVCLLLGAHSDIVLTDLGTVQTDLSVFGALLLLLVTLGSLGVTHQTKKTLWEGFNYLQKQIN